MSLRRSIVEHFVLPPAGRQPAAHEGARRRGRARRGAGAPPAGSPDTDPQQLGRAEDARAAATAQRGHADPPAVGLLCPSADAPSFGAALGLALAARHRAPVVAVCLWTGETPAGAAWRAPAHPAARRLVANLVGRGHDARAAGRLVIVRLPADPAEAVAQARRASAAAGATPVVLTLGGPRLAAFDELLAEQDLVVVATAIGTDPALARLALAGVQSAARRACLCEVPPARAQRSLAAAGLTLLPSTRRALAVPVEALS